MHATLTENFMGWGVVLEAVWGGLIEHRLSTVLGAGKSSFHSWMHGSLGSTALASCAIRQ